MVRLDLNVPRDAQRMLLLADAGTYQGPVRFYVDGKRVDEHPGPRAALWAIEPGEHRITARYVDDGPESEPHVVVVR